MKLTKEDVLNFIPHRDPFLFIDSVEEITYPEGVNPETVSDFKDMIGGESVSHFKVKEDLKVLEGHFPGNPILPGVVQIEMMAQGSTFINYDVVQNYAKNNPIDVDVALLGCDQSRFRKPVVPGMDLVIKSKLTKVRGNFVSYTCQIFHNDELISQADILASHRYKSE